MKKFKLWNGFPSLWLGFSLAFFANLTFTTWQFWAILVPWAVLQSITDKQNEKD